MEEATVSSRTIVLDRLEWMSPAGRAVYFGSFVSADPSESWDAGVEIKLTPQAWADIGLPEKLTVTLVPGDTLNKGDRDGP